MDTKERDHFIWEKLNQGMSLSDVQHALNEEFGIRMTYLDLRMLAATLPVEWEKQDKPKTAPAAPAQNKAATQEELLDEQPQEEMIENDAIPQSDADEPGEEAVLDTVVTLDETPMPGAAMSGTVRFMSGISCGWYMDRMGRLGLNLSDDAKDQPTDDDMQAFQVELQRLLQERAERLRKEAFDGTTQVEVSPLVRPGCEMNGSVTFSSGAKGEWFISQGKLDFALDEGSSKPTRDDMEKFSLVLSETLRQKGYR